MFCSVNDGASDVPLMVSPGLDFGPDNTMSTEKGLFTAIAPLRKPYLRYRLLVCAYIRNYRQ